MVFLYRRTKLWEDMQPSDTLGELGCAENVLKESPTSFLVNPLQTFEKKIRKCRVRRIQKRKPPKISASCVQRVYLKSKYNTNKCIKLHKSS